MSALLVAFLVALSAALWGGLEKDQALRRAKTTLSLSHENRRQANAQHLGRERRHERRHYRSDRAAASLRHKTACHGRRYRPRDQDHAGPRRTADRSRCGLWGLARYAC